MPRAWLWVSIGWLALAGCGGQSTDEEAGNRASDLTAVPATTLTLSVPKPLSVMSPVLVGVDALRFGAGANVVASLVQGSPPVVAMGRGGLRAEPDAAMNDAWSRGKAELRDRVRVRGSVHASSLVLGNGVVISGAVDRQPVFDPPTTLSWKVTFPGASLGNVNLEPDQRRALAPGRYSTLRVASRARLSLRTGTYYLSNLQLEPQSTVELDQAGGPVIIYAADGLQLRGTFRAIGSDPPDLLVAQLGAAPVVVEQAFDGVLLAPSATLTLRKVTGEHRGYFYAKTLELDAHASVRYRAPLPILTPASPGIQTCANLVPVRPDLSGKAQAVAYQRDIARFCSMPGSNPCVLDIAARTNVDFNTAAFSLLGETLTPPQYLALLRDRMRKERATEDNPTLAQQTCNQPDGDGDLVPDGRDVCPNTPPLTPTFDNGCTDPALPPGPSADDVGKVLTNGGILVDPACSGAKMLPKSLAGAFYRPANPELGTYVISGRVTNQPPGCRIYYFFDVEELAPTGPVRRYQVVFSEIEQMTSLVGLAQPVPAGFIQFNPLPTEPGTRGFLGSAGGRVRVKFRVRAMNGAGMRADWSEWKFTTPADCIELGFVCSG